MMRVEVFAEAVETRQQVARSEAHTAYSEALKENSVAIYTVHLRGHNPGYIIVAT